MAITDGAVIYLDNAWVIRDHLTRLDDTGTREVPATGLAVEGWLSATPGGEAIDPALRVSLTMRGTKGRAAVYASEPIDEAVLAAHLTSYANPELSPSERVVWEVTATTDGDYRSAKRRRLALHRPGA